MIGKILSSAIKLYLRSQVDRIEGLKVKITGKSKQILQGDIPQVSLSCDRAVYQGLHLSQIELEGNKIAINLPEVIKKQPLRLIEPILVEIQLKLNAEDLQASLESELLQSGLRDLWTMILAAQNFQDLADAEINWQNIAIADNKFKLLGNYQDSSGITHQLTLSTGINLTDEHTLCLSPLNIINGSLICDRNSQVEIDLGSDVKIETLIVESKQIVCLGKIRVNN